ncbi:MAG: hypothetical protein U0228_31680 [Myxococcaceae bacterium]
MLVALTVLAALPAFDAPRLLVDLETSPSTTSTPELVSANADGVLYTQLEPGGGAALWWSGWQGAPVRLLAVVDPGQRGANVVQDLTFGMKTVLARPLGTGLIVFARDGDVVTVSRVEGAAVTPLITVTRPVTFPDTDRLDTVWWSAAEGTFVTDGTPGGTSLVTPLRNCAFVLGTDLWIVTPGQLRKLENGELINPGFRPDNVVRAGHHLVIGMPFAPAQNELREVLATPSCTAVGGGEFAWIDCATSDGRQSVSSTDGTPGGTTTLVFDAISSVDAASADYLVFSVNRGGPLASVCVSRTAGGLVATPFSGCTLALGEVAVNRIVGDTLVSVGGLTHLPDGTCLPMVRPTAIAAAGREPVLQLGLPQKFVVSDGTDAGTREVPEQLPAWPTSSSSPRLLGGNGSLALFDSTRGVWMTDGTQGGTRFVGQRAQLFRSGILAFDGEPFVVDDQGRRTSAPAGVEGVSRDFLVGRSGCDLFFLDEARQRRLVPEVGCVDSLTLSDDGALISNSAGVAWLFRPPHAPLELGRDVSQQLRCGKKLCWFLSRQAGETAAKFIDVESGAIATAPGTLPSSDVQLQVASDVGLVYSYVDLDGRHRAMIRFLDGQEEVPQAFVAALDGTLLRPVDGSLVARDASGERVLLECPGGFPPLISFAGSRVNALCTRASTGEVMFTGSLDGPFHEVALADDGFTFTVNMLPYGDGSLVGFSKVDFGATRARFVVTDGDEVREFPAVRGEGLVKVRAGWVFIGSPERVKDNELWVLPLPQSRAGCGCDAGGVELAAVVVLLLLRGRMTRARPTGARSGPTPR